MISIEDLQKKLKQCDNLSEVAVRAKVTRSYLSAIANGKRLNPTYHTMKKIYDALQVK